MTQRKRGFIPSYWWDFNDDMSEIIIETDDPRSDKIIKRFPIKGKYADAEIKEAEAYIIKLKAGN